MNLFIIFVVVIFGILILNSINNQNTQKKRELDLKQKEIEQKQSQLDADPAYRKQMALLKQRDDNKLWFESSRQTLKEYEYDLEKAIEKDDKKEIDYINERIKEYRDDMIMYKKEYFKLKKMLEGV